MPDRGEPSTSEQSGNHFLVFYHRRQNYAAEPFEVEDCNVTVDTYRNLIVRKMFRLFQSSRSDSAFQQDRYALHKCTGYRVYLSRSANITGLAGKDRLIGLVDHCIRLRAIFLWSCTKSKVYATIVADMEQLRRRIKLDVTG